MKLTVFVIPVFLFAAACVTQEDHKSPYDYVDPFIGTTGGGNVHPGATLPFAMLNVTPHTETLDWSNMGYNYRDSSIVGFVHNQVSGIGNSEFGNFLLLPVRNLDPKKLPAFGHRSLKAEERAAPGFYGVHLLDDDIHVEVTATERSGHHRYMFKNTRPGDTLWVILNLARASHPQLVTESSASLKPDGKIYASGTYTGGFGSLPEAYTAHFAMESTRSPDLVLTWKEDQIQNTINVAAGDGAHAGVLLGYVANGPFEVIELNTAISYTEARKVASYIDQTTAEFVEFEQVKDAARDRWTKLLNRFRVRGGSEKEKTLFYTSLYRMYLMPTNISGETPSTRKTSGPAYTNYFAIWDTYRAPHPWLTLADPSVQRDMLNSLLDIADEIGWLPDGHSGIAATRMQGGSNADVLYADAWVKGIEGVDYQRAYKYVRRNATIPSPDDGDRSHTFGRHKEYLNKGWISADKRWASVSKSLEFAYNDYAAGVLAEEFGTKEEASRFYQRSDKIFELFDDETGFFRPKNSDGSWVDPFDPAYTYSPTSWTYRLHYYEGSAWQYVGYIPHRFPKFINALGGEEAFIQKWDEMIENRHTRGYYTTENEPDILSPYQYIYAGRPDKVQEIIPQIIEEDYDDRPGGWPGNDDSGTLSAWYVFSALGFFPNAGQDWYFIGTPMFDRAELELEDGSTLIIEAKRENPEEVYISSATIDGEQLDRAYLLHDEIKNGAHIIFEMSDKPTRWAWDSRPPSPPDVKF